MRIYIAASWKHRYCVELLTAELRRHGYDVDSFVEHKTDHEFSTGEKGNGAGISFEEWVWSKDGEEKFKFDTDSAINADAVIYISPSGQDAWAEIGAAWASGVKIIGMSAKGEGVGLMRRMVKWVTTMSGLMKELREVA